LTAARKWSWCALALLTLSTACDDDPTEPSVGDLTADVSITPDTLGVQEAIRIVFNRSVDAATALDPANFVVTDLCDSLRVAGSVRLAGDTLIFSPSERLEFLTLLSVRVQNILGTDGLALRQPIVFQRITRPPPVSDASWAFLNSPTNDFVTGINFANPDLGYLVTLGGSVYRTVNGGAVFGARFNTPNITEIFNIETFGGDTVLMVGATLSGGSPRWTVFRSLNGALTFQPANLVGVTLYGAQFRRTASGVIGVVGGQSATPGVFRYRSDTHALTAASGIPGANSVLFTDVALSADTIHSVATFFDFFTNLGSAYRSVNGGASYTALTLPANPQPLFGTGFINSNTALLLGDSSEVMRVDLTTGTVTRLGATQGIPQTDIAGNAITVYTFTRARFTDDGQLGWIIGYLTRRLPGSPDVVQGVILQSRDGGQTWLRQAISGAPENGLAFPPVRTVQALSRDFAVLSGDNGLVAARVDDSRPAAGACSFTQR
jgi:hypothetical protein